MSYEDLDYDPYSKDIQEIIHKVYGSGGGTFSSRKGGAAVQGRDEDKVRRYLVKKLVADLYKLDPQSEQAGDITNTAIKYYQQYGK